MMRVAVPPAIGIVQGPPRMSKTIACQLGETSREIQLASSVIKLSFRGVARAREFVRVAALAAESFWVGV